MGPTKRTVILLGLVALVAAWAATSLYIVDTTEYAVVLRLGRVLRTHLEPGLYVKAPWPVDAVTRFDNRLMVLESPAPAEPDREYLTRDEQSGIGKNVIVTTYTCWRLERDAAAVQRFLETMGDRSSAEARLADVVISELGAALGQTEFARLVSTDGARQGWRDFLEQVRSRSAARVTSYGIELVDVQIQRLNFPDQNRSNVFERMRAERETIAARYRAAGEEQAAGVRAEAERQRDEILAQAEEQAQRVRGAGDAEAARIYADAYGVDPAFYEFSRTLEAYEKTLTAGTVAILSGGSDFLRLLNRAVLEGSDAPPPATQPATRQAPPADRGEE